MSRTKKMGLALSVLGVLALFLLWYLWPRSFPRILPGFRPEEPVTVCSVILVPNFEDGDPTKQLDLYPDSPAYAQLMQLLHSVTYTRSPSDLLRLGRPASAQLITLDPYYAHIVLCTSANHYELSLFGPRIVTENIMSGVSRSYLPQGGQNFQQQIVSLLLSLEEPYI